MNLESSCHIQSPWRTGFHCTGFRRTDGPLDQRWKGFCTAYRTATDQQALHFIEKAKGWIFG
jgi:hypothetical protein